MPFRCIIAISLLYLFNPVVHAQMSAITDPRDGKEYPIIQLIGLNWFATNLDYYTEESRVYSDDIIAIGDWGRLYNRKESELVCPEGWRLPTTSDWEKLSGWDAFALMDTTHWKNNGKHTNESGLNLQPSGMSHRKKFWNQYLSSTIWFSDGGDENNWHLHVHGENGLMDAGEILFHTHKESIRVRKFAVRCVCEIEEGK